MPYFEFFFFSPLAVESYIGMALVVTGVTFCILDKAWLVVSKMLEICPDFQGIMTNYFCASTWLDLPPRRVNHFIPFMKTGSFFTPHHPVRRYISHRVLNLFHKEAMSTKRNLWNPLFFNSLFLSHYFMINTWLSMKTGSAPLTMLFGCGRAFFPTYRVNYHHYWLCI